MAPVPTHSPVTGQACAPSYIHADSAHFRDQTGRTLLLRGVNLAASAKTPRGQPSHKLAGFWEHARSGEMSFVGRVLELEDADVHLERLREWGFTTLRYVTTWESIEHAGPGKYDEDYLDYTVTLLRKCKEHGFRVYMDPHQDLWSRFAGGSGAPYWSLLACGLKPEHFTYTNAAVIECEWPSPKSPAPETFPKMIWASNYARLACQTLFTLFFAGRDFAPLCVIDGENIQDWLTRHFLVAFQALAERIHAAGDLEDVCVIGWDSMNEPNPGLLSTDDITQHSKESVLRVGPTPTALQAMRLGMGERVEVDNWRFGPVGPKRDGSVVIDPQGRKAWLGPEDEPDGVSPWGWRRDPQWQLGTCVWALHGVWDPATDTALRRDYFVKPPGASKRRWSGSASKIDFGQDYWLPHFHLYARMVRSVHKDAILFAHSPVFHVPPRITGPEVEGRAVFSTHWYDGLTLITKHWNWFNADTLGILRGKYPGVVFGLKIGEPAIRKCFRDQFATLRQDTFDAFGEWRPTMMGEFGIPYDLDDKRAYSTGDYSQQIRALDASMNANDGTNLLNYTIWCYAPDNDHEHGDLWNGEDLSVFSTSDVELQAVARANQTWAPVPAGGNPVVNGIKSTSKLSVAETSSTGSGTRTRPRAPTRTESYTSTTSATSDSGSAPSGRHRDGSVASLKPLSPVAAKRPDIARQTSEAIDEAVLADPYAPIHLNDGSRALSAFCRPYPIATVGTPLNLDFDIRSSLFSLTIEVASDDVVDPSLPTEIYVPLVHYAEFPASISEQVREQMRASKQEQTQGENGTSDGTSDGQYVATQRGAVDQEATVVDDEEQPTTVDETLLLSLDVNVSAGTWVADGKTQRLKWWYPRPAPGQPPITHKIEIKRSPGPIAAWRTLYGGPARAQGWGQIGDDGLGYEWHVRLSRVVNDRRVMALMTLSMTIIIIARATF